MRAAENAEERDVDTESHGLGSGRRRWTVARAGVRRWRRDGRAGRPGSPGAVGKSLSGAGMLGPMRGALHSLRLEMGSWGLLRQEPRPQPPSSRHPHPQHACLS